MKKKQSFGCRMVGLAAVDCFDDSLVAAATLTCCRYSVAESGSAA